MASIIEEGYQPSIGDRVRLHTSDRNLDPFEQKEVKSLTERGHNGEMVFSPGQTLRVVSTESCGRSIVEAGGLRRIVSNSILRLVARAEETTPVA